jgi:hypothetical protein
MAGKRLLIDRYEVESLLSWAEQARPDWRDLLKLYILCTYLHSPFDGEEGSY